MSIESLKQLLAASLPTSSIVSIEQLRPPEGVPTGLKPLDDFLLWQGLPKGDLTLLQGPPGLGATSLWCNCVRQLQQKNKWAAWINSEAELTPHFLIQNQVQLSRLVVARKPKETGQLFWLLQELISSSLFEVVGCHLEQSTLKPHQLQKIKKMARLHKVSVVFISNAEHWPVSQLFPLIIRCDRENLTIRRALHRPAPITFSGVSLYVDFVSQLTTNPRAVVC